MKLHQTFKLLLCLALPLLSGALGSLATYPNIESWYQTLTKPVLTPPNWIFGPVWTSLYLLMGISLFLIWRKKNLWLVKLFFIHLVFNTLWSIIFFGFHQLGFALIEIILLWIFIAYLTVRFWQTRPLAGALLIPYLLWVSFATYLNFSLWLLNP